MSNIAQRIDALLAEERITPDVAAELHSALTADAREEPSGHHLLAEVLGYLGAMLVVVGIVLVVGSRWASWNAPTRQAVLVVIALALLVAAARVGAATDTRRRLAGVLGAAAIVPAAALPAVALLPPWDERVWPAVAIVVATWSYIRARTVIGLLALVASTAIAVPIWTTPLGLGRETAVVGSSLVVIGFLWLLLGALGRIREDETCALVGSALVLVGSQMPAMDFADYVAYASAAVVSGVLIFSYLRWTRHFPVLGAGVIGIGLVCGELVFKWTGGDAFGAALALVVAGLVMLLVSLRIVNTLRPA